MASVNYNLRFPNRDISPIQLDFHFKGARVRISIGESINTKNWSFSKQRAKKNTETTQNKRHLLNDFLDTLETQCERIYNEELKNGTPKPEIIQQKIHNYLHPVKVDTTNFYGLIQRFINNEITINGKPKEPATIKTYKTTLKHLQEFELKEKYKIDFDTVNLNFYHRFTTYLTKNGKGINSIGKYIQVVKVFMSEAVEMGLTGNIDFKKKKFAVKRTGTDSVYLTEKEVIDLYNFNLTSSPRLERVRDLFVFGCFVGLRFSDYSNVKPENIVKENGELFLKVKTKKTGEIVIIPCHPIVSKIFKKYKNKTKNSLPPAVSNQKFNQFIKEAAKLAGLTDIGRLTTDLNTPLFKCISSHTARRSFATNYYLQGFPTLDLMKITGHRTERAFLSYIRVSKLETAKRLGEHMKKTYSKKVLSIAV